MSRSACLCFGLSISLFRERSSPASASPSRGPGNGILWAETGGRFQPQNAGERPEFGSQTATRLTNRPELRGLSSMIMQRSCAPFFGAISKREASSASSNPSTPRVCEFRFASMEQAARPAAACSAGGTSTNSCRTRSMSAASPIKATMLPKEANARSPAPRSPSPAR